MYPAQPALPPPRPLESTTHSSCIIHPLATQNQHDATFWPLVAAAARAVGSCSSGSAALEGASLRSRWSWTFGNNPEGNTLARNLRQPTRELFADTEYQRNRPLACLASWWTVGDFSSQFVFFQRLVVRIPSAQPRKWFHHSVRVKLWPVDQIWPTVLFCSTHEDDTKTVSLSC